MCIICAAQLLNPYLYIKKYRSAKRTYRNVCGAVSAMNQGLDMDKPKPRKLTKPRPAPSSGKSSASKRCTSKSRHNESSPSKASSKKK